MIVAVDPADTSDAIGRRAGPFQSPAASTAIHPGARQRRISSASAA